MYWAKMLVITTVFCEATMNKNLVREVLNTSREFYPKPLPWKELYRISARHCPEICEKTDDEYLEQHYVLKVFVAFEDNTFGSFSNREVLDPPQALMAVVEYLKELKLVTTDETYGGQMIPDVKITAKGIDHLEDDGGLSAILNTVTVKFDIESTRELLASGLFSMGVPEEKKGILRQALEGATTDTIKELVKSVLRNPKGAMDAAQNLLNVVF
jgi:hypothetical protein